MNYFIADPHFEHASIIRMCSRPFADVDEMNRTLIQNWNSRVRSIDTVYVLGDVFLHSEPEKAVSILEQLKGKKILLVGNHDGSWMSKVRAEDYFEKVELAMEVYDGRHVYTLCHYPMLSWRREKKTYMIFGHIHDNTEMDLWPLIAKRDHMLNAGVEINHYQPVTFEELVENNAVYRSIHAGDPGS